MGLSESSNTGNVQRHCIPTFHTQTIGRILRVPATRTEDRRNVLKTGYLYTNYQRNEVSMPEPSEENQPKYTQPK